MWDITCGWYKVAVKTSPFQKWNRWLLSILAVTLPPWETWRSLFNASSMYALKHLQGSGLGTMCFLMSWLSLNRCSRWNNWEGILMTWQLKTSSVRSAKGPVSPVLFLTPAASGKPRRKRKRHISLHLLLPATCIQTCTATEPGIAHSHHD